MPHSLVLCVNNNHHCYQDINKVTMIAYQFILGEISTINAIFKTTTMGIANRVNVRKTSMIDVRTTTTITNLTLVQLTTMIFKTKMTVDLTLMQ